MPRPLIRPRLTRRWVKLVGSDCRLEYSQKLVRHPHGCTCHPIANHFHYEADRSQTPQKVALPPLLLEDNGDGTFTSWSCGLYGPVGSKGTLKDGDRVEPLSRRQDFEAALSLERQMDFALVRQAGMAAVLGGARNALLCQLAQDARQKYQRRWGRAPDGRS